MDQRKDLSKGSVFSMPVRRQSQLRVIEGRAWITLADSANDHILNVGEVLQLKRNRLLVAEALQDSVIVVETVVPQFAYGSINFPFVLSAARSAVYRRMNGKCLPRTAN